MLKFCVLFYFLCIIHKFESARILGVFPAPSQSHAAVFRVLTKELSKRGHELVVITPDPAFKGKTAPTNFTEIDVHDVSYKVWNDMVEAATGASLYMQLKATMQALVDLVRVQLETPQVKEFLAENQKFDLVLTEASIIAALGYAYKFNAPVIQVSSFYGISSNFEGIGAPTHMFLYPAPYRKKLVNLTMKDKIKEVIIFLVLKFSYINYENEINRVLKIHFGPDTPKLHELESNVDMLFVNTNPVWEGNRPVPSSVVYLGQFHVPPEKDLPQDLKSYLDSSRGVIYVSFGSNFSPSTLSAGIKLNTLAVTIVGIPLRADQFYNTEKYIEHKIGEKLNWDTLTEDDFYKTILKVVEDDSYRQNVVKLRDLMADQPQSALERAVWWTEHVLRHRGARHLRSPAAGMGWIEYLELQLVAVLLSILVATVLLLIGSLYVLGKFVKKLFSGKSKRE